MTSCLVNRCIMTFCIPCLVLTANEASQHTNEYTRPFSAALPDFNRYSSRHRYSYVSDTANFSGDSSSSYLVWHTVPTCTGFWSSAPSAGFLSHRRSQIISDLRSITPQRRPFSKILKDRRTGGRLLPRGGSKWGRIGANEWPELKEKGVHPKCQSHHLDRNMDHCGPRSLFHMYTPCGRRKKLLVSQNKSRFIHYSLTLLGKCTK